MNGIELCEKYYKEIGRPAFEKECPEIIGKAAFGLAGEGSDCLGFDDEISRDHDWGPGFCIWLSDEDFDQYGEKARQVYNSLPAEFMGFQRLRQTEYTTDRVGVQKVSDFMRRYTGLSRAPETLEEWNRIFEGGLIIVSNGVLWDEGDGYFAEQRKEINAFFPEPIRKQKLAFHAFTAAQSGQYNYYRIKQRGDNVAVMLALSEFISNIQSVVFLLNLKYRPYYKWSHKAMKDLPILGAGIAPMIESIASDPTADNTDNIEGISALVIEEFRRQGLSSSESDFLLHHAEEIKAGI